MRFSTDDIERNREFFAAKLRAYRQLQDVVHKVKQNARVDDFLILDVRSRDAFTKGHIPGALSLPIEELSRLGSSLPRDRELVTFCWSHL